MDLAVPGDGAVGRGEDQRVRRQRRRRAAPPAADPHTHTPRRVACSTRNCALGPSNGSAMRSVSIEKPVANISVSTTSCARCSRGVADEAVEVREVGVAVLPDDVVLDRGDPHERSPCKPRGRFVDHLEALAAREAHQRAARVLVVVERHARDGDDAAPLGERSAERDAVVLAEPRGCRRSRSRCPPTAAR